MMPKPSYHGQVLGKAIEERLRIGLYAGPRLGGRSPATMIAAAQITSFSRATKRDIPRHFALPRCRTRDRPAQRSNVNIVYLFIFVKNCGKRPLVLSAAPSSGATWRPIWRRRG